MSQIGLKMIVFSQSSNSSSYGFKKWNSQRTEKEIGSFFFFFFWFLTSFWVFIGLILCLVPD